MRHLCGVGLFASAPLLAAEPCTNEETTMTTAHEPAFGMVELTRSGPNSVSFGRAAITFTALCVEPKWRTA